MKKGKWISVFTVLLLMVWAIPVSVLGAEAGTITVTGQYVVRVEPDIATISLGVSTNHTNASQAQAENSKIILEIMEVLAGLGIEESDVETSHFSIYPDWFSGFSLEDEYQASSYTVSNNLSITVRDMDIVGKVMEMAMDAGANSGGSIEYGSTDAAAHYEDALRMAVEDAASKGKILAAALGGSLGNPVEVTEQNIYSAPVTVRMSAESSDKAAGVPIMNRGVDVSATVEISFEFYPVG